MTSVLYGATEKSLHKTNGRSLENSQGILPYFVIQWGGIAD